MSSRVFCESCCACLTAYFAYLCMDSFYDKCARKVSNFIDEQNDLKWRPRGLLITDPLERGLRVIEITVFLDKAEQRFAPPAPQPQSAAPPAVSTTNSHAQTTITNSAAGTQQHPQQQSQRGSERKAHRHHSSSHSGGGVYDGQRNVSNKQ